MYIFINKLLLLNAEQVLLIYLPIFFFRYKLGSTKECTRIKRDKTATRIFNLSPVHPLPSQTVLLSVTANKSQLINFIKEDLKNQKNDLVLH